MISEFDILRLKAIVGELKTAERYKELLDIIGVPTLQQLNIEAAKTNLSPLVITKDYRFLLTAYKKEVLLPPIHKALYILFLKHPQGIEFKKLIDYKDELMEIYRKMGSRSDCKVIEKSIDRLVNPLDNSVNEKCARIKSTFALCMDQYQLNYYIISGHTMRHIEGSSKIWYERKKSVLLPRELVTMDFD